jgi:hypothetical protein
VLSDLVANLGNNAVTAEEAAKICFKEQRRLFRWRQGDDGRTEVAPYPIDEVENKYRFIRHVEKTEKIEII